MTSSSREPACVLQVSDIQCMTEGYAALWAVRSHAAAGETGTGHRMIRVVAYREADPARRGDSVLRVRGGAGRGASVQVPIQHVLWAREQPLRRHLRRQHPLPSRRRRVEHDSTGCPHKTHLCLIC